MEVSEEPFCSAVKTVDNAATAAALWDPWLGRVGIVFASFALDDGLKADERAANADALWVGPPFPELFDLSLDCKRR